MRRRTLALTLALALLTGVVAGCGAQDGSSPSAPTQTGADENGSGAAPQNTGDTAAPEDSDGGEKLAAVQELNLLLFDNRVYSLDTGASHNPFEWHILGQTGEGLFRVFADENGFDVRELAGAESYEISDDGLTYTFKLRDHNWEDGAPVTAQNYVDAFVRVHTPENAFTYSFFYQDIVNAAEALAGAVPPTEIGVRAVDDKTLEIKLTAPAPYFLDKLTLPVYYPVRADLIGADTDSSWGSSIEKTISNGPFKFAEWVRDTSVTLVKNPEYWDADSVRLEKVTLTVVNEDSTRAQLFNAGQLDVVSGAADYFATWKAQADAGEIVRVERFNGRLARLDFPWEGGTTGLTNNLKIRQALSLAIDRQEAVDLAFNGLQLPAYGLYPTGVSISGTPVRELVSEPLTELAAQYVNDDAALRKLFDDGLAEEGFEGTRADVTLSFFTTDVVESLKVLQEYIKQTWETKLGINVNIDLVTDQGLAYQKMLGFEYDVAYSNNISTDYNDPYHWASIWSSTGGTAQYFGGYNSPRYDAALSSLAAESDPAKRAEIYAELERILVAEDYQIVPIYYSQLEYFAQPYIRNFDFTSLVSPYEYSRAYIVEH
ncbi:MAG: peptide ABC transporter substrate-binding protein [Oscillospiraceae bacterium]|jgi:oligopeptide transport system substrate-binding protein|nr:peptide ABC transporter substrate-binding protein [Oscillospiraceae bacterium]